MPGMPVATVACRAGVAFPRNACRERYTAYTGASCGDRPPSVQSGRARPVADFSLYIIKFIDFTFPEPSQHLNTLVPCIRCCTVYFRFGELTTRRAINVQSY